MGNNSPAIVFLPEMASDVSSFHFTVIEEKPLMENNPTYTIVTLALIILIVGIAIHFRILNILSRRQNEAAIDKLFWTSTVFSLICQPIVILYYTASHLFFPMSDYIGVVGCILSVHILDVFIRFYYFCFPITIALTRYLFVVRHLWVKSKGMKKVVKLVILGSFVVPLLMTLSVQFPISDSVHGAFNRCIGRFEMFFNPQHPDPITPGRRGGETHCVETGRWAFNAQGLSMTQQIFRIGIYVSCTLTTNTIVILMFGLPEIVLYSFTFVYIVSHNRQTALAGILQPEVIRKRKLQNSLNIIMTFWVWLAQLGTNIIYLVVMFVFYGKVRFYHHLFVILTIGLNFNVLPLFYIVLADNQFKTFLLNRDYYNMIKLFFAFH